MSALDLAHIDKLAAKAARIREAQKNVAEWKAVAAKVNKYMGKNKTVRANIVYNPGDQFGNGRDSMPLDISTGVVQQALIHAVMAAERALVAAEGSPL